MAEGVTEEPAPEFVLWDMLTAQAVLAGPSTEPLKVRIEEWRATHERWWLAVTHADAEGSHAIWEDRRGG